MSVKLPISHTELMNWVTNKGNLEQVQLTNNLRCELWNSNPDLIVCSDSLHLIFLWLIQWCTHMQDNAMYVWNSWRETLSQSLNWNICNGGGYIIYMNVYLYDFHSITCMLYAYYSILKMPFSTHEWTANEKKSFIFIISTCHGNVTVFFHRHWNLIMFQRKMLISKQFCFFLNNRSVDCILRTFNLILRRLMQCFCLQHFHSYFHCFDCAEMLQLNLSTE